MGEIGAVRAIDVSDVVRAAVPNKLKGVKYGIEWTGDRCLCSVTLYFDYLVDIAKTAEGMLRIEPGTITMSTEKVFEREKAIAVAAGKKEGDAEWPRRADPQAEWAELVTFIGNGDALTAASLADFLTAKSWAQYLVKCEWAKRALTVG